MYCTQCGTQVADKDKLRVCPKCNASLPLSYPDILPAWARLLAAPPVFGTLLTLLLLVITGGAFWLWRQNQTPDPSPAVRSFYEAIASRDKDKALAALLPVDREKGLNFCLNLLMQPNVELEFTQLNIKTLAKKGPTAEVRAIGDAQQSIDGSRRTLRFNDVIELTAEKRKWYLTYSSLDNLSLCGL